jgi:hypothetical protein
MSKQSFPIGSLDKTKRFIKTAEGWVSVKKMAKQGGEDTSTIKLSDAPVILSKLVAEMEDSYKQPRFSTIYEAQVAWLKKEITHKEYLLEQAAMYAAGVISKEHRSIKLK